MQGARFVRLGRASVPGDVGMHRASLLRLCIFSLAVPLAWVCKANIHFYRAPAVPQNCPQSHSHDDQRARAPSCEAWVFLSVWEFDVGISAGKLGSSLFGLEVEALCESCHGNYGTVVRFPDARLLARLVRKMHRAAMVSRPALPPPLSRLIGWPQNSGPYSGHPSGPPSLPPHRLLGRL